MPAALNATNLSERSAVHRMSGLPDAESAIRAANEELQRRVGSAFDLPLTVLVEQRNRALREAESARERAEAERRAATEEQDRFIAFLMADHERQLGELEHELERAREALDRKRSLEPVSSPASELEAQLSSLQECLQAAYAEVDDTRADAARLQEERDEAIRETNDVRFECQRQIENARDEAARLELELDEAERRLADAADQARDDACALSEQLDEVRRELDERDAEVRALHARLPTVDKEIEARLRQVAPELDNARKEAQLLRRSLIEAKREASRWKNELESLKARTGFASTPEDGAANERRSTIQRRSPP